jgi:hypothetical protein
VLLFESEKNVLLAFFCAPGGAHSLGSDGVSLGSAVIAISKGLTDLYCGWWVNAADIFIRHEVTNPQVEGLIPVVGKNARRYNLSRRFGDELTFSNQKAKAEARNEAGKPGALVLQ